MQNCNFCKSENIKSINLNYKLVTSDIQKISRKPKMFFCLSCNLLQKAINKNYLYGIEQIYKNYDGFEKYDQLDQTKFIGNIADSRCNIIYQKIFKNHGPLKKANILDFGCSSGAMIKPFLDNENNISLYGTDVKDHINKDFKKNSKFKKFIPLKNIYKSEVKFDYIFLIHVFEHLIDIDSFLENIPKILKKNGKVIIQIPNYHKNPFDLFIYDHTYHYNKISLANIFGSYSYKYKISDNLIQGEYFITLQFLSRRKTNIIKGNIKSTNNRLNWIKKTLTNLSKIKKFSVVGSSVTSLIIVSNFYHKIISIYDEDINRQEKLFGSKRIKSMSKYNKEKLFFPFYGSKLKNLKTKFQKKYKNLKVIL